MGTAAATKLTNPFVGLRAFEESEDYLFFGRAEQVKDLLEILGGTRFLAVIGSSGSGKSSLVKSGLLPAVYRGFMTVGANWRAVTLRPGENPIGYLAEALATEGILFTGGSHNQIPSELIIESTLRRSENGLVQVYKDAHLPPSENLLIVVDQFEELFRFSRYEKEARLGQSDALHFAQLLLTAVQQKEVPVYVLLTMRADFLGDCAEFRGLPEAINEGQYLVPRMKRHDIREAITGPVAVSGAAISQRLVTRLLNDVNNDTDQLPILQHALMRTWDAWHVRNEYETPIDFEDYEKIGTMKAALSQHADEAYAELADAGEKRVCEAMFKALTDKAADVRGIRRPRSVADLTVLSNGTEAEVKAVVETFRKTGRTFLMPPPAVPLTKESVIDISHESLMRVWERLARWINEESRNGDIYLRLANSAQLKAQGQRGLLKNPELALTLQWKERLNPTAKWAEGYKANFAQAMQYLEDSRREEEAERKILAQKEASRKRLVKAVFLLLGSLLVTAVIVAFNFRRLQEKANDEKHKAEAAQVLAMRSDSTTKVALVKLQESTNATRQALAKAEESDSASQRFAAAAKASRDTALQKQREANANAVAASNARDAAISAQEVARRNADIALAQNRKIAANEYARLIREGPSEENRNKDAFYAQNFLSAYAYHFNQLEGLMTPEDKGAYLTLKNRLYYNNDLYKQLYEAVRRQNSNEALRREPAARPSASSPTMANGAKVSLTKNTKGLTNTVSISGSVNASFTPDRPDAQFLALAVGKRRGAPLVLCSTTDKLIYVLNEKLEKVDAIAMGTKVTALDFFDDGSRSIIYFGTAGGYIGYIVYNAQKKNQPVFENRLESEIVSVRLFSPKPKDGIEGGTFLLAAGKESSPRVYKLDAGSLKPDKLLYGNELLYAKKTFGAIASADYDYDAGRVLLYAGTGVWSWNPFTQDLLKKLNDVSRPDAAVLNGLKLY